MPPNGSKEVTIPKSEYEALIQASIKLSCLEKHGVDNWTGYDDAMSDFREEVGEDD
ncbi:hypothetical protein [Bradyrhizobium sp. SZCCHNRI2010]|uniref:hypothetical protein n=1 Tax=Bradyrhizobium sp. SZCCHNRI2010 TaxID=3057283 RepID=UPI0028F0730B|nr:hypothetical protein [Bradyrhizobium sp. SZCCHNRI2010]